MKFLLLITVILTQPSKFTSLRGPIYITAEVMKIYRDERRIELVGNVSMKQDELIVYAERAEILMGEKDEVKRIKASGKVKAVFRDKTLSCDKVDFDVEKGYLFMFGHPVMSDRRAVIRGEMIKVDVNKKTVEVKNAITVIKEEK